MAAATASHREETKEEEEGILISFTHRTSKDRKTLFQFLPLPRSQGRRKIVFPSHRFFPPFCGHAHLQRSRGLFFQSLVTEAEEGFSELSPLEEEDRFMQSLSHFRDPSPSNQKNFSFRISLRRRKRGSHTHKNRKWSRLIFFSLGPSIWIIASFSRKEKNGLNLLCVFENTFFRSRTENSQLFEVSRHFPAGDLNPKGSLRDRRITDFVPVLFSGERLGPIDVPKTGLVRFS